MKNYCVWCDETGKVLSVLEALSYQTYASFPHSNLASKFAALRPEAAFCLFLKPFSKAIQTELKGMKLQTLIQ